MTTVSASMLTALVVLPGLLYLLGPSGDQGKIPFSRLRCWKKSEPTSSTKKKSQVTAAHSKGDGSKDVNWVPPSAVGKDNKEVANTNVLSIDKSIELPETASPNKEDF